MNSAPRHLVGASRYGPVVMATLDRNYRQWKRFKPSFYMEIASLVVDVLVFIFLSRYFAQDTDYVAFVIVGLIFVQPMSRIVSACYNSICLSYWTGRLEAILLGPVPILVVVVGDVIWAVIRSILTVVIYLCVGWAFGFRITVTPITLLLAVGLFCWGALAAFGVGLVSASMFTLINAKGFSEPVNWVVDTLQRLVSGVYFPIAVLPRALLGISWILPQTHVVNLSRSLILGQSSGGAVASLIALLILTPVYLVVGWYCFSLGLKRARVTGDLSRWV